MGVFEDIHAAIGRTTESTGPSVVGLGQRWGVGSGIVIGEGRVLTNAHNVRGGQTLVTFADGRSVDGRVLGVDLDGDLAVVEVDTGGVPGVEWGAAGPPDLGTPVFALANPVDRG